MDSLSSLYLDAFVAVARTRNFSQAAALLHITQSALSQRVLKLEDELESALFIRDRAGVRLTELGETLLRYCQNKSALENEFLSELRVSNQTELGGEIRIGGFSSVMRSVVLPALSSILRAHPKIRLSLMTREMRDLPGLLKRGEIDFMVLDHPLERDDLETVELGRERNVLIQSNRFKPGDIPDIYLDHDEMDPVTENYFKLSRLEARGPKSKLTRRYLGDVYALIDGVRNGIGKAVVPRHLIQGMKDISILSPGRVLEIPVVLHFYSQPFYSRLQKETLKCLRENCAGCF